VIVVIVVSPSFLYHSDYLIRRTMGSEGSLASDARSGLKVQPFPPLSGGGGGGMERPVIRTSFFVGDRPLLGALWVWAEEVQPQIFFTRYRSPNFTIPREWTYWTLEIKPHRRPKWLKN